MLIFGTDSEVIPEKRRRAKHSSSSQALVGIGTPAKGQLSRTDGLISRIDGVLRVTRPDRGTPTSYLQK